MENRAHISDSSFVRLLQSYFCSCNKLVSCYGVCGVICCRYQSAFHNVDLTSLREAAVQEYFKQPIVVSASLIIRCHYDYSVYLIYKFCSLFYLQNCTSAIFFSDELKISKSKVK